MKTNDIYLASKPRYEILDGLRGVAAVIVVAYHLLESYFHGDIDQPLNHGYLAVDFFFVLSGFVIGYAYDDRWDRMTVRSFFKRRLVRLHPMVIFGTVFGALLFYLQEGETFPLIADTDVWMVLLCVVWCCTMIPMGTGMDIRGWAETNPLDGPAWSLQWEYVANILYALVFRRVGKWVLGCCVAVFAMLTVVLCLNIDIFGVLEARSSASYTVIGGWCLTPDQLQIGFTRLCYPFFMGLLLSRLNWKLRLPGGFWWCALSIVVLLGMPWMGCGESRFTNGVYECVCILVGFPLIVCLGAGSSELGGKSEKISKFLGDISYPLYITHYPLIYIHQSWVARYADAPLGRHVFVSVCIFILTILVASASYRLYDLPVREWLKNRWFKVEARNA